VVHSATGRLVVVGGGVVGWSVAWRAARAGWAVTLVDEPSPQGGSWVAGGMLAPVGEAWPGEEALLALGVAGRDRWPAFAAELAADSGHDLALRDEGALLVGVDTADTAVLDTLAGHLAAHGHPVEVLTGRELRRREPSLGPRVRGGLLIPDDLSVDNRALLAALRAAGTRAGVDHRAGSVTEVGPGRVTGTSTVDGDVVVLAAGAWSGALHPALAGAVRPVKGEILRLAARPGSLPPPVRTVRALVRGRAVYLVPRPGGLVLGATQYEAGFDPAVTVAGVRDLLTDAEAVLPGIAEYAVLECAAGFRAGSPDNLPVLGWLEPGVLAATGHSRNGLLLAPITADAVLALLSGEAVPEPARAADPGRFEHTGGHR
jgi:glycine oxidase